MKPTDFELAAKGALSTEFEKPPFISRELIQLIKANAKSVDSEFDKILPPLYRYQSKIQWSSVAVARAIATWIKEHQGKRFIDIGSGIGKLCITLRLLTDLEISGIEQRPHLVNIAKEIVKVNNLQNISFSCQNLMELNWQAHDIYYLFNPFQEHISLSPTAVIDNTIEFHRNHFMEYTKKVFEELEKMDRNKIFITYHGYGGKMPKSWVLKYSQYIEGGFLSMWIKAS